MKRILSPFSFGWQALCCRWNCFQVLSSVVSSTLVEGAPGATNLTRPALVLSPIHFRISHVTHMDESCHTCKWVMSHTWMSHVTHMNESCHTYEWAMSHIRMSHVTRMDWDILCMYTHMNTHMNTHTNTHMTSHVICDLTHDIIHMYTHMNGSCHTYKWVMSHVWLMTSYASTHTHTYDMHVHKHTHMTCMYTHTHIWHACTHTHTRMTSHWRRREKYNDKILLHP